MNMASEHNQERPLHIGVIMDGNGRWATARQEPRSFGHRKGAETLREIAIECKRRGIASLTAFAFSSENWHRPSAEVNFLFDLVHEYIENHLPQLMENDICLSFIGDIENLPQRLQNEIRIAEQQTASCTSLRLVIALNYGGQDEIRRSVQKIAKQVEQKKLEPEHISVATIQQSLDQPNAIDLVVRTSGEQRLSNFLPWQTVYSELVFVPEFWPDFTTKRLGEVLEDFYNRDRRFGTISSRQSTPPSAITNGNNPSQNSTSGDWSDLMLRSASAAVILLLVIPITIYGGIAFTLLCWAIGIIAVYEWLTMAGEQGAPNASLAQKTSSSLEQKTSSSLAQKLLAGLNRAIRDPKLLVPALGYFAIMAFFVPDLRSNTDGLMLVAGTALVSIATDVGAYIFGKFLGGRKLAPSVSKGKTWSGALGGLALGTLAGSVALADVEILKNTNVIALSAIISTFSQIGDLAESKAKRSFGVKDSSKLIPGHGGILDRIDGLAVAYLAVFVFTLYI